MSIPFRPKPRKQTIVKPIFYALVEYPDQYVQPLICKALKALQRLPCEIISSINQLPDKTKPLLQYTAYEALDFEHAMSNPTTSLISAYVIRKALIRKHYLSNTISTWLVKHPKTILRNSFKACEHFELDYAEFLDDALVEAWDLTASMERNMKQKGPSKKEWWILKPGMSDGGNGIRLFSSVEELQEIFEDWDEDSDFVPDSETDEDNDEDVEEQEDSDAAEEEGNADQDFKSSDGHSTEDEEGAMTSQLRHFIVQPYIDRPLLLASMANRKFHIRAYVLAVGALRVYVYRDMLALFAAKQYSPPWDTEDINEGGLASQLTNTCFQDESTRESSVRRFWALQDDVVLLDWQEKVFSQICEVTGEVFEAASREQMVHFQTLPNAFEVFGVDFLVDENLNVWLLELNAYPDFKQTGQSLQDQVVGGLLKEVATVAIAPFFDGSGKSSGSDRMILVKSIELGRG
jgi:tubulin--tyrosine ligase